MRQASAQDPRLTARLTEGLALRITRLADSARAAGLPPEPLIQKALEGESKGADAARIEAAVAALLGNLTRARDALGAQVGDEVIVAGAQALRLGATVTQLRDLQALQGDRPLVVPLGVFTDLLAAGVPIVRAWQSVQDVARHGGEDQQFERLRERVSPQPPEPADRHPPPVQP
ncbi:MAG: hypothetical protein ABI587_01055 [Gemmatimonadales bacterium]